MLIKASGKKPFIFLSNTKAASTSILNCNEIVRDCEIRIHSSVLGKHISLSKIKERFGFIFEIRQFNDFEVIMIVRNPLDWFISWFKYRQTGKLKRHPRSSYGLSSEEFFEKFRKEGVSQSRILKGIEKGQKLHLIRFGENFLNDLRFVAEKLQITSEIEIPHLNKSTNINKNNLKLSEKLMDDLRHYYNEDFLLWEKANIDNSPVECSPKTGP